MHVISNHYHNFKDRTLVEPFEEGQTTTPEFIDKAFHSIEFSFNSHMVKSLQHEDEKGIVRNSLASMVFTQLETGANNKWYSTREQVEYLLKAASEKLAKNPTGPKAASLKGIIERAQKNLEKLAKGEQVSLPSLYHSTSRVDALVGILKTSVLAQDAVYGRGAYFSSKPEKEYGTYAIALDINDVYDIPLAKQNLANMRKVQEGTKSVWRAFAKDVPVNVGTEDNVISRSVYVIVANDEQRAEVNKRLGVERIKNVSVILKEEAKLERKFLKQLRGLQEPISWKAEWEKGNPLDKLFSKIPLNPVKKNEDPEQDDSSSDSDWT